MCGLSGDRWLVASVSRGDASRSRVGGGQIAGYTRMGRDRVARQNDETYTTQHTSGTHRGTV
eukprot:9496425-Pyramimonas_sp.AAC.1